MARIQITREHLIGDDDRLWAERYKGVSDVVGPEERAAAMAKITSTIENWDDVWVFGYGSLIWNPALDVDADCIGTVFGFHRSFCLRSHIGRGTPEKPGLMLGLDRGGSCRGMAYRLRSGAVANEIDLLFKREMLTRIYTPTWVKVRRAESSVRALTFVVDRDNERYAPKLPLSTQVAMIAEASGQLGPCYEYLFATVSHLSELGIEDKALSRLAEQVAAAMGASATGRGESR